MDEGERPQHAGRNGIGCHHVGSLKRQRGETTRGAAIGRGEHLISDARKEWVRWWDRERERERERCMEERIASESEQGNQTRGDLSETHAEGQVSKDAAEG